MDEARRAAIAEAVRTGAVLIGPHAQREMHADGFTAADVLAALMSPSAEMIEDYPAHPRGASFLLLAWVGGRPMHVVITTPPRPLFVITVYDPRNQPARWSADLRRRMTP